MPVTRETVFQLLYPNSLRTTPEPGRFTSAQVDRVKMALDDAYEAGKADTEIDRLLVKVDDMHQKPGKEHVLLMLFAEGKQAFFGGSAKLADGGALTVSESDGAVTVYAPHTWRFFTTVTAEKYAKMQREQA